MKRLAWLLSLMVLISCSKDDKKNNFQRVNVRTSLKSFTNCEEIIDYAKKRQEAIYGQRTGGGQAIALNGPPSAVDSVQAESNMDSTSGGGTNITNLQENGADEAGLVKVSSGLIITSINKKLQLIHRQSLDLVGSISLADINASGIYIVNSDNKEYLVLVGRETCEDYYYCWSSKTKIKVYNLNGSAIPALFYQNTIAGTLVDSRVLKGDQLTIVTNGYVDIQTPLTDEDQCASTYYPIVEDHSYNTRTFIHGFDFSKTNHGDFHYSESIIGKYDRIYASAENFYLFNHETIYTNGHWSDRLELTTILKVQTNAQNKKLFTALGIVDGHTIGSWAFKEYATSLAVATSTSKGELYNHLYVLEHDSGSSILRHRSAVRNYGRTEDIRSVRYIDDKAYVVTFKKTDPLHVIDLSNLDSISILGELKVPGFSKYMHPMGDDKLVGLGYAADDQGEFAWFQGVQLSLFDISDDYNPTAITQLELGVRGSYSDALFDHQAFYYNNQKQLIGFPVVLMTGGADDEGWIFGSDLEFVGAKIYGVSDDGFSHQADISHSDLMSSECLDAARYGLFWWSSGRKSLDINRMFDLDGRFFSLSRFGLRQHNTDDLTQVVDELIFDPTDVSCKHESGHVFF